MFNLKLDFYKSNNTVYPNNVVKWATLFLFEILFFPSLIYSQTKDAETAKANKERFEYTLFKNPKIKMKVGGYIQPWIQYAQWNPGSTNEAGEVKTSDVGMSVRRLRLGTAFTFGKKVKLNFGLGENNFNAKGKTFPFLKILDLYATYNISKPFAVAFGKSTYDGLSRYTATSTSTMMQTDLPLIALPNLNYTDDLTRELSLVFLGDIGKLNYRMVFIHPFSFSYTGAHPAEPKPGASQFTDEFNNLQYATYIKYDFLEKENNRGPNFRGTYLGAKKILSLGVGAKYQHDALYSIENTSTNYHDMNLWSADLYWDHPVTSAFVAATSAYIGYFNYDFGPNYLRNIGVNNPAYGMDNGYDNLNGSGNYFPFMGSGESVYAHFGVLFNKMGTQTNWGQLEPYAVIQTSNFDALKENMVIGNLGVSWYLKDHYSKISLDVQNRPIFSNTTYKETDRKYMCILQYQYILH
ncbi:conserved hypothetical protein [Formosa agariphila KMM 3901]|uniref:Phosphate-selective porin O and P n=1 Tax=Formosa agariphila (strain DSM 15362 / KCTC 12365 / LMG 23005 / KMM 3901 / M-2Alg 35-1) TaxID=1347342 RepID=T2KJN6_FORAG|nr:hypothetical protein [Formosa agariphila]CDF78985.1 conserved hypothetical protein [Formosa agariphila KMM 3901]